MAISLTAAVGVGVSAAASAAIVVASSGPSKAQYPAGRKLDDTARIPLQKDDTVTVLDKRGTKVLRGPGRVAVSAPGRPAANGAFAMLTRQEAAGRARTGAVRAGDDGKVLSPNLWYVDLAKPGVQCVTAPGAVALWRADVKRPARYRIAGKGAAGTVAFAADAAVAGWDSAKAPIGDGASYTIAPEGGAAIGSFKFAVIGNPPANAEDLAQVLIAKGCSAQLDLLSTTLAAR